MSEKNGDASNNGAVVGLLGFLVFFIGLCGTIGSFLFAAAEGRGRWTVFYGAIVWGLVQIIWGFVLAIRASKTRGRADYTKMRGKKAKRRAEEDDEDTEEDDDEEDRPSRRRETARKPAGIPLPVVIGCGAVVGSLLLGLVGLAVVMIIIESLADPAPNQAKGDPPPKNGIPVKLVDPVAEDLGPKQAQTLIAGATQDPTFKDQAPDGGMLIGLDVGLAQAYGVELVQAIQPRFKTPKGEVMGRKFGTNFTKTVSVKAKPGYAVGAINVKAGMVVNGLSVKFMRLKGTTLDTADSYTSEWIGDQTGGSGPTVLGGDGSMIIGIIGKRSATDCNGLGLLKRL